MQILGQSLIPVNPVPYLHLGYFSAAAEQIATDGWHVLVFSVILGFCLFWLRVPRLSPWLIRGIAVACVVFGILFNLSKQGEALKEKQYMTTYLTTMIIHTAVTESANKDGTIPNDLRYLVTQGRMSSNLMRDGWKREMRWTCLPATKDEIICLLQSAGPDGIVDTDDDSGCTITVNVVDITRIRGRNLKPNTPATRDAWGTPFRLAKDKGGVLNAISAGADRQFNTADDINIALSDGKEHSYFDTQYKYLPRREFAEFRRQMNAGAKGARL